MKTIAKILSLILALMMVVSVMASCDDDDSSSGKKKKKSSSETSAAESVTEVPSTTSSQLSSSTGSSGWSGNSSSTSSWSNSSSSSSSGWSSSGSSTSSSIGGGSNSSGKYDTFEDMMNAFPDKWNGLKSQMTSAGFDVDIKVNTLYLTLTAPSQLDSSTASAMATQLESALKSSVDTSTLEPYLNASKISIDVTVNNPDGSVAIHKVVDLPM